MRTLLVLATLLALAAGPGIAAPGLPEAGPDVPTATAPVVVHTPFEDEVWSYQEGPRTRTFAVPDRYDRVVLSFTMRPDGDPWDRLFVVAVGGVEVLRGTTPRTDFTVEKDVTRYASLLPPGGEGALTVATGTYVGRQLVTASLRFHADEPTALLVEAPASSARPVALTERLCGGAVRTTTMTFPDEPPSSATVELTMSGHGEEEFAAFSVWPRHDRTFTLLVDGVEVARATNPPWVYAFLGFYEPTGSFVHGPMWWTAQRAANVAGVHTGVGEIPPYRFHLTGEEAALLTGTRTVELRLDPGPRCTWITSASILLRE